ncbi:hypothetical protein [Dehalococcoides mccartyi]|jgi:hypothetical protein|uniref:hypothetical protein n=1 Tax=Dehalococcoides mccartyi TaxID=61435 RepID=UPI0009902144|nr:hypothetical protein [Dehalococcoides mccartyi]AQU06084.1 hypothetical protein B1777_05215 [Dehalococcoides mccartyi]AQU07528.1 hypothetical protein B1778_05020 [Dehalococcoides mccartyi]AQX74774.1 hypothetical protein B1776_04315 [Dehalococcoides mccartyi]AQY73351.1 hypothetical protein B1772_04625 [Dehalococcoides mccartyi]QBX64052.1 hypothetical protein DhcFL2_04655 [Dehalococcoides mccartyi]
MTLAIHNDTALALPDEQVFLNDLQAINHFQVVVRANMVPGQDYGVIPGTQKPTLLKPGAEKIAKLLGLADQYEIDDRLENWEKPFFRYLIKCTLTNVANGVVVSEGLGECNSMESKYRWRTAKRFCPSCGSESIIKGKAEWGGGWICHKKQGGCGAKFNDGDPAIENQEQGRIENDDIYSQVNTILKMAKKRALVDAALSAGRLSNVFTQDVEDLVDNGVIDTPKETPAKPVIVQPEKISRAQTEQLKELKDLGFDMSTTVKQLGITAKSAAELTHDQAEILLIEAGKQGYRPTR